MNFQILTKRAICSPDFNLNQHILHETNENILFLYTFLFIGVKISDLKNHQLTHRPKIIRF